MNLARILWKTRFRSFREQNRANRVLSVIKLLEQLHDRLGRLVGDRQRLDAELRLHLQRLQFGRIPRSCRHRRASRRRLSMASIRMDTNDCCVEIRDFSAPRLLAAEVISLMAASAPLM